MRWTEWGEAGVCGGEEKRIIEGRSPPPTKFPLVGGGTSKQITLRKNVPKVPPRRQVIRNGRLDWDDLRFAGTHSSLEKVAVSLRTIRNNLFHGGKHGDRSWDDPDRITFLLQNASEVIDRLACLHDDLHEYYRQS